jgi:hypothetical protein
MCTLVDRKGKGKLAYLMGDSHAIAMSRQMKKTFEKAGIGLIQATERGCPPVQGVYVYESESDRPRCFGHNEEVYAYLEANQDIDYVVLVARWAFYLAATRYDNGEGGVEPEEVLHFGTAENDQMENRPAVDRLAYYRQAYVDSVRKLVATGKNVILVYPIPVAGWDVPRYVRNYFLSDPDRAFSIGTGSTSYAVFHNRNKSAYQALDTVGEYPNLFRIYPENIFCNNDLQDRCIVQKNGEIFYSDDDHLSAAGAQLVLSEIMNYLD